MAQLTEKQIEQYAEIVADRIQRLEGDYETPWVRVNLPRPQNLDGREYDTKGINSLMLSMRTESKGYETPVYITFHRAKEEGVRIQAGEKGTWVTYAATSIKDRETGEKITQQDYRSLPIEEKAKYDVSFFARTTAVFNLDQTNIRESRPDLWEGVKSRIDSQTIKISGDRSFERAEIDHLIQEDKWIVPIHHSSVPEAYFSVSANLIHLPNKEQFVSNEEYYSTALHEMAHSTAIPLKRSIGTKDLQVYGREELVAELSASVGASNYGFEKGLYDNNVKYIKGWLENIDKDPSYLKEVIQDVHKASNFMIREIDEKYSLVLQNDADLKLQESREAQMKEKSALAAMYVAPSLMTTAYVIENSINDPAIRLLIEGKEKELPIGEVIVIEEKDKSMTYVDLIRETIKESYPNLPELPTELQKQRAVENFLGNPSVQIKAVETSYQQGQGIYSPMIIKIQMPEDKATLSRLEQSSVDFHSSEGKISYEALIRYREGVRLPSTDDNKNLLNELHLPFTSIKNDTLLFVPLDENPAVGKLLTTGINAEIVYGVAELPVLKKENLDVRLSEKGIKDEASISILSNGGKIIVPNENGFNTLVYIDSFTNQVRTIPTNQIPLPPRVENLSLQPDEVERLKAGEKIEFFNKEEHIYHKVSLDVKENDYFKVEYKTLSSDKYQVVPTIESPDKEKIDYIALRGAKAIEEIWGKEGIKMERDSFLKKYNVQEAYREYLDLKIQGEPGNTLRQNEEIKEAFKQEQRKESKGLSL